MHTTYFLATAAIVLITVSSFPHFQFGKRQLHGYGDALEATSSTSAPSEAASTTAAYSSTDSNAPPPFATLSSLLQGMKPSYILTATGVNSLSVFPTGTVPVGPCPLGACGCIPAGATGTGTGTGIGSSPSSTSAPYSYPNATSALPPPGSTGAASNSISGLPTAIFPTGTRPHFGPGPVIFPYGRPTKATGLHGYGPAPVESDTTSSVKAPNLVGKPLTVESVIGGGGYGSFPTSSSAGPSESAISGSGCMPAVTVTKSFTATVTVTVGSGAGSGLPVSAAPFSSAPYPVPGNSTIGGYTTGAGTGLPIGTGTGLPVLPSSKTASATLVPYT